MSYLTVDVECSKAPKHMPWTPGSFLCSVGIEHEDGTSKVWFFNPNDRPHEEIIAEIQAEFDSVDFLVGHNIKFDLNWLKWVGFNLKAKPVWCTMVADYLINGQRKIGYSLNDTAARYGLGSKLDAMAVYWDTGYETDEIPLNIHETYLKQDVHLTAQVFRKQFDIIQKAQLSKITMLTFKLVQILSDVEVKGAYFDAAEASAYCESTRVEVKQLNKQLVDLSGVDFAPSSTAQLSAVLFGGKLNRDVKEIVCRQLKSGKYKITTRKSRYECPVKGLGFKVPDGCVSEKTGQPKTDKNTVDLLKGHDTKSVEFLAVLQQQRKLNKVVCTIAGSDEEHERGLLAVIGSDGRLHGSYNQCVTRTGRLSCTSPNLQNQARGGTSPMKKFFKSTRGVIVNCDLAQIEWRIAAELSRDSTMLAELEAGLDIHAANAEHVLNAKRSDPDFKAKRTVAKVVGFRSLGNRGHYRVICSCKPCEFRGHPDRTILSQVSKVSYDMQRKKLQQLW